MPDLNRLFAYDRWANRETLASLRAAGVPPAPPASPGPPERARQLMAHVIAAELLWHARLNRVPAPLPVWPDLTLEQCEGRLAELEQLWPLYLAQAVPARLGEKVQYTNTKGEAFTSTVDDVLTHLIVHGGYHRGQIAAALRAAGHQPAYTDFIHAARTGRLA